MKRTAASGCIRRADTRAAGCVLWALLLLPIAVAAAEAMHCVRYGDEVVCDAADGRSAGWVAKDRSVVVRGPEGEVLEGRIQGRRLVLRGRDGALTCWISADGGRWHCHP